MDDGALEDLPGLLDELADADDEHPDISVQHESGLSLSVFGGWRLVLEDLETGTDPAWLSTEDRGAVLAVMEQVARGDAGAGLTWEPGYPS
jgi:hypothetical protein